MASESALTLIILLYYYIPGIPREDLYICLDAEVAAGSLPSVVLSQARSRREDLQQVAWTLLRRLRKEAHVGPTQAEVAGKG